jgi:hypothetical protein
MKLVRDLSFTATCTLFVLAASTAFASDASDVMATVEKWIGDYNKGNMKPFVTACAPRATVIDDFPPYAWPTCTDWINALEANNKASHATGGSISLGKPSHTEVTEDHAYMVYPATFSGNEKGKSVVYKGTWTMTLHKARGGWAITGSAWAGH